MAWPFQSPFSLADFTWTDGGPALLVTSTAGVVTTSNSTICVRGDSQVDAFGVDAREYEADSAFPWPFDLYSRYRLWMYGVAVGSVSVEPDGTQHPPQLTQTDNIELRYLPEALSGQRNIAYLQSDGVSDDRTAAAGQYVFDPVRTLHSTGIPSQTAARVLDGHEAMALYKDVHVLELKDEKGWLMLLARYNSATEPANVYGPGAPDSQPGGGEAGPTNTSVAIVGYWCASPRFAKDVKGPYFLVARYHDLVIDGAQQQVPLWLGVPSACEMEVDGEEWLYVYYAAELTTHANATAYDAYTNTPDFVPGTFAKRIRTGLLPWGNSLGLGLTLIDSPWGETVMVASTDETLWNSKSGLHELAGEKLGKVNIWVAEGDRWKAGDDPGTLGNRLIWEVYEKLKDVDAVPALFDGGVALYFAGNHNEVGGAVTGNYGWGIWRGVLGPETAGRVYGTDFVVRPVTVDNVGGNHDLVARSNPGDPDGRWKGDSQSRLDPDPVRLPSGEWIVFSGSGGPEGSGKVFPLERFETTADVAEATYREAWA